MSNQNEPAKKRGCFFYGCLSLTIIALVVVIFVGVGIYFAKRAVDGLVSDYTAVNPEKIEELVYPAPRMTELQSRVDAFQQAVKKGGGQPLELVLTADDLNALISANADLKGKLFVRIADDQVKGQISVPLPDVGPLKLKGRYLNGTAAFKAGLNNGRLNIRVDQMAVRDKPVPPLFLSELQKIDLAEKMQKDPEASKVLARIDSLEVREDKIFIRSKPLAGDGTTPATPGGPPAENPPVK